LKDRGSLTIEATVIIPVIMIFFYLLMVLPLSTVYFDKITEDITVMILKENRWVIGKKDITSIIDDYKFIELKNIEIINDEIYIELIALNFIQRGLNFKFKKWDNNIEKLVYVTDTGYKFHEFWCKYLRESMIPMEYSLAILKYGECKSCYYNK